MTNKEVVYKHDRKKLFTLDRKLLTADKLASFVTRQRSAQKRIVFTNGCFDILHAGHVRYLTEAKNLGDILIIGLNSDKSVSRLKGNERPVNKEMDRALVISALEMVDYLIIFEEDTPYNLINRIKPAILVKGGDWQTEDIVGSDIVQASGGEVMSLPFYEGSSTTGIIEKLKRSGKDRKI